MLVLSRIRTTMIFLIFCVIILAPVGFAVSADSTLEVSEPQADSIPQVTNAEIAGRYDLNRNGTIQKDEAIAAVRDYFSGEITKEDVIAVIRFYFSGGTVGDPPSATEQLSDMIARVRPAIVKVKTRDGQGSGVIFKVEGEYSYVITNQHVVDYDEFVTITVRDIHDITGYVLGADSMRDLAVVRINCGDCSFLEFEDSEELRVGDEVLAVGYPKDRIQPKSVEPKRLILPSSMSVTRGIISAFRRDTDKDRELVQTDAPVNSGNSGGPLLSMDGKIVGINTFGLRDSEGLNYAISETTIREHLPTLISGMLPRPTPEPPPAPRLITVFGPLAGHMHEVDDGYIVGVSAHRHLKNVIVGAWFENPYSATVQDFSYGFLLRRNSVDPFLVFYVHSDGRWKVFKGRRPPYETMAEGRMDNLRTGARQYNYIEIGAIGGLGFFTLNGSPLVPTIGDDPIFVIGNDTRAGEVEIITGAVGGAKIRGTITHFENFRIRIIGYSTFVSDVDQISDVMTNLEDTSSVGPDEGTQSVISEVETQTAEGATPEQTKQP